MLVTVAGISILVRPVHPENMLFPIAVMPGLNTIVVRPVQPEKTPLPIYSRLSGSVTFVISLLFLNKSSPSFCTV